MAQKLELDRIGLCDTCLKTIRSVLQASRGADLLCFEVLDNCRAGLSDGHGFGCANAKVSGNSSQAESTDCPPPRAIGLCANCAHLNECTQPRPESGVWHCEDYK